MFGIKRSICNNGFSALISQDVIVTGSVNFDSGTLKVEGTVLGVNLQDKIEGNVNNNTTIHFEKESSATINKVAASNIIINSTISADVIHAEKHLHIGKNTVLKNTRLLCRSIYIEPGAILHQCTIDNLDIIIQSEMNQTHSDNQEVN